MSGPRIEHVTSIEQLRSVATAWDDLWWRSDAAMPTLRAELIAQWMEHFAPRAEFHALAVEAGGRLVAALPLLRRKLAQVIDAAVLPANEWSVHGELLLDPAADVDAAMDRLVEAMGEMRRQLLWLDEAALETSRWQALLAALARAGVPVATQQQIQFGRIEIDHDWPAYRQRWSRKHRQGMARAARRLAANGDVQFDLLTDIAPGDVETLLRRGFEVENLSWKGGAGSSVLATPGAWDFYLRQARQLARWGQLELAFLHCNNRLSGGRPIAFAYGLGGKGVYHSIKVGYDPRYAQCSPGQLLRYYTLEKFFRDPSRRAVDYIVPSSAHQKWKPCTYTASRLAIAPGPLLGRVALHALRNWWPWMRRMKSRGGAQHTTSPLLQRTLAACSVPKR